MNNPNDILIDFVAPCGSFSLTFDDDGKVAYAYLKQSGAVVGDVWIYNRCSTPDEPEWKDRSKAPFANPKAYTKVQGCVNRAINPDDVQVQWQYEGGGPRALLYLFGELVAAVGVGDKPGFSRFAAKDGPLAKLLVVADGHEQGGKGDGGND